MSKCRKAFEKIYVPKAFNASIGDIWQEAWNAAIEHAANVCREQMLKSDWPRTPNDFAEAIRKEKTE